MTRTTFRCIVGAALVACAAPAGPAAAQVRGDIRLYGRVIDDVTSEPIPGATVELLSARGSRLAQALTNDNGTFSFIIPQHAGYQFRASRIGYRRTNTPTLWTEEHDTLHVEIRLDQEAVLLAPLEVTAWSRRVRPSPVTEGFRDRMASGLGFFVTRQEIEERKPIYITDMLASVPGVQLMSSGRGTRRHIYMTRTGDHCPAQIFVDGFLLNGRSRVTADPDFTLDDAVAPSSVEGIEVYHGLATVPAQFLNPDSRCGAVVVWTRRGG
jgi:hypothetical protein